MNSFAIADTKVRRWQWVHYVTPRIMQTRKNALRQTPRHEYQVFVWAHPKISRTASERKRKPQQRRHGGRFSFARYFWPLSTESLRNSLSFPLSLFFPLFFLITHVRRRSLTNKSRKLFFHLESRIFCRSYCYFRNNNR